MIQITPELEKALKKREVLQIKKNGVDVRLYDNDQILVIGKETRDGKTVKKGNTRVTEELELPIYATLNLRTYRASYVIDTTDIEHNGNIGSTTWFSECFKEGLNLLREKGVDIDKWKCNYELTQSSLKRFTELSGFVEELHSTFVNEKWKRHPLAIRGFLPTLAGHGNMHPLAALHPYSLAMLIKGTVFPFEKIPIFDFEQARAVFEKQDDYLSYECAKAYEGSVCLIKPWSLWNKKDDHTVVQACFFNPTNYKQFLDGNFKVQNELPSIRDWIFNITYGSDFERNWLHFSAQDFSFKFHKEKDLLCEDKNHIYLKATPGLVETIEKIAPFPW